MIILEYSMDHPLLRQTRQRVPETEIRWENSELGASPSPQFLVWVTTPDWDAFDEAVADDPSVTNPVVLTESGESRMYRFDFTDESLEVALEPEIIRCGGKVEQGMSAGARWEVRMRLPDREAAHQIVQFCRENDIEVTILRVFSQTELETIGTAGMTDAQRETLLEALECGYLEIPRECSLTELGDRLGVSESAASQRFRRGVKNLIQQRK
jgi:predicted DNA binding protein